MNLHDYTSLVDSSVDIMLMHQLAVENPALRTAGFKEIDLDAQSSTSDDSDSSDISTNHSSHFGDIDELTRGGSLVSIITPPIHKHGDNFANSPSTSPSKPPDERRATGGGADQLTVPRGRTQRGNSGSGSGGGFVWGDFTNNAAPASSRSGKTNEDEDEVEIDTFFSDFAITKTVSKPKSGGGGLGSSQRRLSLSVKACDELEEVVDDQEVDESAGSDFLFGDFVVSRSDNVDDMDMDLGAGDTGSEEAFSFGDFMVPSKSKKPAAKKPAAAPETKPAAASASPRQEPKKAAGEQTTIKGIDVVSTIGHKSRVRGLALVSKEEHLLVSVGGESHVVVRGAKNHGQVRLNELLAVLDSSEDTVLHVAASNDLKLIGICSADGSVSMFEVSTSKKLTTHLHPQAVTSAAFSSNGRYIITGCQDGACRLWPVRKKANVPISSFFGHRGVITTLRFQMAGELVASAASDKTLQIWNGATAALNANIKTHQSAVHTIEFSNDGRIVLSADKSLLLLSAALTGQQLLKIPVSAIGPSSSLNITTVGFAPLPTTLPVHIIIGTSQRLVILYELRNFREVQKLLGEVIPADRKSPAKNADIPSSKELKLNDKPVWSTEMRGKPTITSAGPTSSVAIGDGNGNISLVNFRL